MSAQPRALSQGRAFPGLGLRQGPRSPTLSALRAARERGLEWLCHLGPALYLLRKGWFYAHLAFRPRECIPKLWSSVLQALGTHRADTRSSARINRSRAAPLSPAGQALAGPARPSPPRVRCGSVWAEVSGSSDILIQGNQTTKSSPSYVTIPLSPQ